MGWCNDGDVLIGKFPPNHLDRGLEVAIAGHQQRLVVSVFARLIQQMKGNVYVCLLFFMSLPAIVAVWAFPILLLEMPHDRRHAAPLKRGYIAFMPFSFFRKPSRISRKVVNCLERLRMSQQLPLHQGP
jgi:hypothetical protein